MKTASVPTLESVVLPALSLSHGLCLALLVLLAPLALAGTVMNYTMPGNYWWTCPPGIYQIQVECYGGGGGGGGTATAVCAAGGGAGGTYVLYSVPVMPGTVYNLTVGAGGSQGSGEGASSGGSGGDSYFGNSASGSSSGASVLAPGGNGGAAGTGVGVYGAGGDAKSAGSTPVTGTSGAVVTYAAKGGDATATPASSGAGSACSGPVGGVGGGAKSSEGNGNGGVAAGGGGGGGFSASAAKVGGSGAAGRVTLTFSATTVCYTTAGTTTWVAPFSGTVQVECWGGGGGGAGVVSTAGANVVGGGGGGGAYARLNGYSVTAGNSYAVVVGAGGAGGSANNDGNDGGDSYFVSTATVLAVHGSKGIHGVEDINSGCPASGGGSGGAASSCAGDVKNSGGNGYPPAANSASGGGGGSGGVAGDGHPATSSVGAAPVTGGGNGGNGQNDLSGDGSTPTTFPGGGGGGGMVKSKTNKAGGAGAAGQVVIAYTALTGNDYRSKNSSGSWASASDWEVSTDGGATWATAGSKPGAADNVYIQSGHSMALAADESCADLHIARANASGDTIRGTVALGAFTLSVHGKMRCYYAAVGGTPGTSSSSGYNVYPFTASGGKVSIAGYSRALTLANEWSGTISSPASGTLHMSIDLAAGQTATLSTSFKATSWTLNSGTLDCGPSRLAADNSVAGQGDVTINSGAVLRSAASGTSGGSQVMSRTNGGRAGTLTIAGGGKLQLSGTTPCVDMHAIAPTGAIEYTRAGAQTLAKPSGQDGSAAAIATYQDLILNGNGVKTLSANATVNGILTMAGDATGVSLGLSTFTLSYGASSTLAYAGSAPQTANTSEFPAATVNNLTIANTSGVSLGQGVTVSGTLTVNSGCNLHFNSQTITTASAPVLNGTLTMPVTRTAANTFTGSQLTRTGGTLTYGGTLSASLLGGGPILAGEAIPLFVSAGGFAGGFSSVTAPSESGLTADTSPLTGGSGGVITYAVAGSSYENWAGVAAFDADANGDGVKNGLAFLLGASSPTAAVTLPAVTQSGGNLVMTFQCLKDASRGSASLSVEHSSNLGISDAWLAAPVTDAGSPLNNVTFSVSSASATLNNVTATVSSSEAASGKLFGRLKSTGN